MIDSGTEEKMKRLDPCLLPLLLVTILSGVIAGCNTTGETRPGAAKTQKGLTDAEKIYGLSLLWMEATYNFAFFDQVPDLDWDATYRAFIPKVLDTRSTLEYYGVLERFYALLQDGHTEVAPPESLFSRIDSPGVVLGEFDQRIHVVRVLDSLVDRVPLGSEVIEVEGIPIRRHLEEKIFPYVASSTRNVLWKTGARLALSGERGATIRITLRLADGRERSVELRRDASSASGRWVGPQSPRRGLVEFRWLDEGIACLALGGFHDERVVTEFEKLLPELQRARGLILDLRENGGGSGSHAIAIVRHLTDRPFRGSATRMRYHVSTYASYGAFADRFPQFEKFREFHLRDAWISNEAPTYDPGEGAKLKMPLVVLTGHRTASAAEDMLLMLDSIGRGVRVGEPTRGSTGQPLLFDLPGGGRARVCTKRDTYPDGRDFVGVGILPHHPVSPTIEDVISGRDAVLEKGVEVLESLMSATPQRDAEAAVRRASHAIR